VRSGLAMEAAMRGEGGRGGGGEGMVGGLGLRGEGIPWWVAWLDERGYFSGARGTHFQLSSTELT
jgi:hypothetical protein